MLRRPGYRLSPRPGRLKRAQEQASPSDAPSLAGVAVVEGPYPAVPAEEERPAGGGGAAGGGAVAQATDKYVWAWISAAGMDPKKPVPKSLIDDMKANKWDGLLKVGGSF